MKTCPFCKEKINVEATKCRYCASDLEEKYNDTNGQERYVTYILDKDLIRFVKIASSFLAVFLVVGAFLYGFDLQQAAEEIRDVQTQAQATNKKMQETEQAVAAMKEQVQLLVQDAEKQMAKIKTSSKKAEFIVLSLQTKQGEVSQTKTISAGKNNINSAIRRDDKSKLWLNGTKLQISFIDGENKLREKVKLIAQQWLQVVNLGFEFGSWPESEIRTNFQPSSGSWSFIGTDALSIEQNSATMVLLQQRNVNSHSY